MSNSDFYIQNMIETSLEQEDFSQIIILLDSLPSKNIRRALYLLSKIFPNKIEITENEFKFIKCILSNNKFIVVQSISDFLRAISILNFNDLQKQDIPLEAGMYSQIMMEMVSMISLPQILLQE